MAVVGRAVARESAPTRDLAGSAPTVAADDGSVPEPVADVLARRAGGRARMNEVVAVLAGHRLLVPLLEVDGDLLEGDDTDPCAGQDRAVAAVSLRTADGPVGLAFTGLPPMADWDPHARPLPTAATRVAGAVLAQGGQALLIDVSSEHACRIEGIALRRLAAGGDWPEPWRDPLVREAIVAELAPALASGDLAVRLAQPTGSTELAGPAEPVRATEPAELAEPVEPPAQAPDLLVDVRFPPGTPAEVASRRAVLVAERLAGSAALRAVFDGLLAVRVLPGA